MCGGASINSYWFRCRLRPPAHIRLPFLLSRFVTERQPHRQLRIILIALESRRETPVQHDTDVSVEYRAITFAGLSRSLLSHLIAPILPPPPFKFLPRGFERASERASTVDADVHLGRHATARGELPPPLLVYARRVNVSSGLYRWSITRATRSCANVEFYVVLDRSEVAGSLVTRELRDACIRATRIKRAPLIRCTAAFRLLSFVIDLVFTRGLGEESADDRPDRPRQEREGIMTDN
jgi:hypothetical protein